MTMNEKNKELWKGWFWNKWAEVKYQTDFQEQIWGFMEEYAKEQSKIEEEKITLRFYLRVEWGRIKNNFQKICK